jgi:YD repeat-containing protein
MNTIEELTRLKALLDQGVITQAEYDALKADLLGNEEMKLPEENAGISQPEATKTANPVSRPRQIPKQLTVKKVAVAVSLAALILLVVFSLKYFSPGKEKNQNNGMYGSVKIVKEQSFGSGGDLINHWKYEYDIEGHLVAHTLDGHTTTFSYNEAGKRIGSRSTHRGTIYTSTYSYNEGGALISIDSYRDGEFVRSDKDYKYDENNRLIWRKGNDSEWTFEYDDKGKLIKQVEKNSHNSIWTETFEYDKKGFRKKTNTSIKLPDGRITQSQSTYSYDKHGSLIETMYRKDDGSETVFSYGFKYDTQGNWVEKISYYNGEPGQVWRRSIKYY